MRTAAVTTDVFMSTPGSVMVMYKDIQNGFYTTLQGATKGDDLSTTRGYDSMRCIITSTVISESANFQFLTTLRNFTYLYAFGDKMSELDVGGIAFLNAECDGASGVHAIYDFFTRNKVSNSLKPITFTQVAFSSRGNRSKTFKAFLGSFNLAITDPASMVAQFSMKLYYMPNTENIKV